MNQGLLVAASQVQNFAGFSLFNVIVNLNFLDFLALAQIK